MTIVQTTLIALAFTTAAVAPAFAGDGGMDDGMAWVLNPGGQYTTGKLKPEAMAMLMKRAKPVKGMVVFMANGKLYMAQDPKGTLYQRRMDMVFGQ